MNKINWQQIPVVNAGGVEQSVPEHIEDLYDLIESSEMEFPVPEFPDDILYSAESSEGLVWNEVNFKEKLDEVLYKLKGEQLFKGAVTQIEIEGQPWYSLGDDIDLENNKFYLHIIQIPYSDDTFDWYVYLCRSVETVEDGLHLRALSVSSNEGFDFLEEPILASKYYNGTLVSRVGSLTGINSLYQINDIDISDYSDIVTILELYFDSLVKHIPDLVGGPFLTVDDSYETNESQTSVEILYASDLKCGLFNEYGQVDPRAGLIINNLPERSIDEQVNIGFAFSAEYDPIELDENGIPVNLNMLLTAGVLTWDGYSQFNEDRYANVGYPCTGPGYSFKIQPSSGGGDLYFLDGHDIQRTEGHIYFIIWREVVIPGGVTVHEPFVDAVDQALDDLLYDVHAEVLTSRNLIPDYIDRSIGYDDITYSGDYVLLPIDTPIDMSDEDSIYMFSIVSFVGEYEHSRPIVNIVGKKYSEWMDYGSNLYFAKWENISDYRVNDNGSLFYMSKSDAKTYCSNIIYGTSDVQKVTFKLYKVPARFKDLDKWSDLIAFMEMGQVPTKKDLELVKPSVLKNLYKHQFKPLAANSFQFVDSHNDQHALINSWRMTGIYGSGSGGYLSNLNVNSDYIQGGETLRVLQPGDNIIALEFDGTVRDGVGTVAEYYPDFDHLVHIWEGDLRIGNITLVSESIVVTNSRYVIFTNEVGEKMFVYYDTDNVSHDEYGGSTRFYEFDGTNYYVTPADGNMIYMVAQRSNNSNGSQLNTSLDSDSAIENPDAAIFTKRILTKLAPSVVQLHSMTITATPTAVSTEFFLSGGDLTGALMAQVFVNGLREFDTTLSYDSVNDITLIVFNVAPPQNSSVRVDIVTQ